jgi:superfamily II DNA/RNA helicase
MQALIIAPTRELAKQIYDFICKIGMYLKIKVHLCTGGTKVLNDKQKLKEGCHIVVGTPGRVRDMMNRSFLDTTYLNMLIIDEADEMLGMGFLE